MGLRVHTFKGPPPEASHLVILQTSFEPSFSNIIKYSLQNLYILFKNTKYLQLLGKHYIFIEFILKQ
jgi:hypothetical protein